MWRLTADAHPVQASRDPETRPRLWLLEFDRRFDMFREFHFYDFHQPLALPGSNLPLIALGDASWR